MGYVPSWGYFFSMIMATPGTRNPFASSAKPCSVPLKFKKLKKILQVWQM